MISIFRVMVMILLQIVLDSIVQVLVLGMNPPLVILGEVGEPIIVNQEKEYVASKQELKKNKEKEKMIQL